MNCSQINGVQLEMYIHEFDLLLGWSLNTGNIRPDLIALFY